MNDGIIDIPGYFPKAFRGIFLLRFRESNLPTRKQRVNRNIGFYKPQLQNENPDFCALQIGMNRGDWREITDRQAMRAVRFSDMHGDFILRVGIYAAAGRHCPI